MKPKPKRFFESRYDPMAALRHFLFFALLLCLSIPLGSSCSQDQKVTPQSNEDCAKAKDFFTTPSKPKSHLWACLVIDWTEGIPTSLLVKLTDKGELFASNKEASAGTLHPEDYDEKPTYTAPTQDSKSTGARLFVFADRLQNASKTEFDKRCGILKEAKLTDCRDDRVCWFGFQLQSTNADSDFDQCKFFHQEEGPNQEPPAPAEPPVSAEPSIFPEPIKVDAARPEPPIDTPNQPEPSQTPDPAVPEPVPEYIDLTPNWFLSAPTKVGGGSFDKGNAVAVLSNGKVLLAGTFHTSFWLDSTELTGTYQNGFVASTDNRGQVWDWGSALVSSDKSECTGLTSDPSDNVYVIGSFTKELQIKGLQSLKSTAQAGFVAKLSGQTWAWSNPLIATIYTTLKAIKYQKTAQGERLYIAGEFQGTMALGKHTLDSPNANNVFLAAFDLSNRAWLWAHSIPSKQKCEAHSIAVLPSGEILIAGAMEGALEVATSPTTTTLNPSGKKDLFLVLLDSTGNPQWAQSIPSTSEETFSAVATAGTDWVWMGSCKGDTKLNKAPSPQMKPNEEYLFVAKGDKSGSWTWVKAFSYLTGKIHQGSLAVDPVGGDIALGLSLKGDLPFLKARPVTNEIDLAIIRLNRNGEAQKGQIFRDSYDETIRAQVFDQRGNLFVSGDFVLDINIDPTRPGNLGNRKGKNGGSDTFLWKNPPLLKLVP